MLRCVEFFLDQLIPVVYISHIVLHSHSICDTMAKNTFEKSALNTNFISQFIPPN